jgi:hypothetical protein
MRRCTCCARDRSGGCRRRTSPVSSVLSIACSAWLRDPHDLTFTRAYSIVFATLPWRRLTDEAQWGASRLERAPECFTFRPGHQSTTLVMQAFGFSDPATRNHGWRRDLISDMYSGCLSAKRRATGQITSTFSFFSFAYSNAICAKSLAMPRPRKGAATSVYKSEIHSVPSVSYAR